MSIFQTAPQPKSLLARHRVLSPTAGVRVSPICLVYMEGFFGRADDPFEVLDTFFEMGGNFIDTANFYQEEASEKIIGNSRKSMHVSVIASLEKLKTDYIDILYVHWWDCVTSVEEVMRGLHTLVMAEKVLYLGVSDTPAWVVMKANDFARQHGLTPFSLYQGKWSASFRDMEAEIIPMYRDQGMAIAPWECLSGGKLLSKEQRKVKEGGRQSGPPTEEQIKVSEKLEAIATRKSTTVQAVALAYLFHKTPYVFPIIGARKVEHVKVFNDSLSVALTQEDLNFVDSAVPFNPIFPMTFLYEFGGDRKYNLSLTAADNFLYRMAAQMDHPEHQQVRTI
ncbi:related to voltage-gated shaker-like K+ channel, subunit beta/KCNAB [Phialocephala subalpina]|uniref:Related to voltage-gated shaker-like K+ channel, subunit beta/KCNAB n=1 Tax=Phialocephala subalpina TaxID=576137 RepID=A0A1L7WYB8_9HELO|nr:related to voltage-gated shaker-like K+ channel, subunit beta/KCNAB [Phialocephala subalpina]